MERSRKREREKERERTEKKKTERGTAKEGEKAINIQKGME